MQANKLGKLSLQDRKELETQHPDLNFHHMLSLKVVEEKLIGDFYSFIPNANYLGLITKSEEKEVLFNLEIKNK